MKNLILSCLMFILVVSCENPKKDDVKTTNDSKPKSQVKNKEPLKSQSTDTLFYNFISDMSWEEYHNCLDQAFIKNPNFINVWHEFDNSENTTSIKGFYGPGYEIIINNKSVKFELNTDPPTFDIVPFSEKAESSLQTIRLQYYDSVKRSYDIDKKIYNQILNVYESKYGKSQTKVENVKNWHFSFKLKRSEDALRQIITWENEPKMLIVIEVSSIEHSFAIFYLSKHLQTVRKSFLLEKIREKEQREKDMKELNLRKKENSLKDL